MKYFKTYENYNRFVLSQYDEEFSKYCFANILNFDMGNYDSTITEHIDKNISKTIIDTKINKPIGIYVLGNISLTEFEKDIIDSYPAEMVRVELYDNFNIYKNAKGVYGIMLAVLPEYRNMGLGKMLIDYSGSISDYIWGMHDNKLDNLKHWEKRRKVVGELHTDNKLQGYITASNIKAYENYAETVGQSTFNVVSRVATDTNPQTTNFSLNNPTPKIGIAELEEKIAKAVYHASPNEYKESILKRGIGSKWGDKQWKENNYPDGTYVFDDLEEAIKYAVLILDDGDVWKIDSTGLDLIVDPEPTEGSNFEGVNSYYIKQNISKEKIKLVEVSEEKRDEVWRGYE